MHPHLHPLFPKPLTQRGGFSKAFPGSDSSGEESFLWKTSPSSKIMFPWWADKAQQAVYSCRQASGAWWDPLPAPLMLWLDVCFLYEDILFGEILSFENLHMFWKNSKITFKTEFFDLGQISFPALLTTVNNLCFDHLISPDHLKISGNLGYHGSTWTWTGNGSSQVLPIKMIAAEKFSLIIFCL